MSVLVGHLEEEPQEQIVSVALNRIAERKGHKFCLRGIDGGGVAGSSKEVEIGTKQESVSILPIEIFQEIKKNLHQSKKKMEELCAILRRNKVKMTPNVRDKLCDIDHLLDEEYTTVKIKMTKKVTVEMVNDPTTKTDGMK